MQAPPDEQVKAGRIAAGAVKLAQQLCLSAIDGKNLDREIESYIRDMGGEPALKGYQPSFATKPYEWSICLGIDHDVVHGVPIKLIGTGHLVTVDLVVRCGEWHADHARTFTNSDDAEKKAFAKRSLKIFESALEMIMPEQSMNLYSMVVAQGAEMNGYAVINEYCGHAIGKQIHEAPQVWNMPSHNCQAFRVGQAYAVEPVLANKPSYKLQHDKHDGFSVRADCFASHNEDTVFVGPNGIVNLTGKES